MLEFVAYVAVALAGYILGFVMGWSDADSSRARRREAYVAVPKEDPTLCQDYSHLKKKL